MSGLCFALPPRNHVFIEGRTITDMLVIRPKVFIYDIGCTYHEYRDKHAQKANIPRFCDNCKYFKAGGEKWVKGVPEKNGWYWVKNENHVFSVFHDNTMLGTHELSVIVGTDDINNYEYIGPINPPETEDE